jgi:hypothetical protein
MISLVVICPSWTLYELYFLLMISVAFRAFEEDGLSVTNSNVQTPIMSPTCWLTHPTRVTSHLARENRSYESSAMSQLVSIRLRLTHWSPSKEFDQSKALVFWVLWFLSRNQAVFYWIFLSRTITGIDELRKVLAQPIRYIQKLGCVYGF